MINFVYALCSSTQHGRFIRALGDMIRDQVRIVYLLFLCSNSCLVMEDKHTERKRMCLPVSHLRVQCIECSWVYTFYKSEQIHHGFDVNRRLVYTMRSIGQGHASLKRFFAHINMPAPLGYTAYRGNNITLAKAAKSVAAKSMLESAAVLHKNSSEAITQCAVSCNGTWQ